ncbi:MAG: transaldolase family protein [Chloroflexota bacterium]
MNEEHRALREQLLFATPPGGFGAAAASVRERLAAERATAGPALGAALADLVAELTIDLGSELARWHLQAPGRADAVPDAELGAAVDAGRALLDAWGEGGRRAAVDAELASIAASNLRRINRLADAGTINTRWGHDAAVGLTWAIRRGAVLVTTNPVMVNTVRKEDPATWGPVRDALVAANPAATPEQRASLMTMTVVLDELRELRPIWTATGGRFGKVSLQINPRNNADGALMAAEVEDLWARLQVELGGTPNAMFKIPGTRAGLDAVRRLTAQGIGVTVTVNASVDQCLAFGEVIEQGTAAESFLVLMLGRLDDPVRDELVAAGLPDAVEVSRWASVAVLRRAYPLLFEERGFRRSAILAASMRGPWSIDGSIVAGPSTVFATCFPDKAREYDSVERTVAAHETEPLPAGIEEKLAASRTFREAYGVGALPPEAFDGFVPVTQTLAQFNRNYDEFVDWLADA